MEEKETKTVSFKDIGNLIKLNWLLITIIMILSLAVSGAYAFLFQKTDYTASVMLEVCLKDSGEEDELAESSVYSFTRYLAKGYKVLMSSSAYLTEYNNAQSTEKENKIVGSNISYTIDDELDVLFTITYTVSDKGTSSEIMEQRVVDTLNGYIYFAKDKIDANNVSVYAGRLEPISWADVNTVKTSKGTAKTLAVGLLIGIVISFVILLFKFLKDDTVGEKEDVELLTGTSVIAFIPLVHSEPVKGKNAKSTKQTN